MADSDDREFNICPCWIGTECTTIRIAHPSFASICVCSMCVCALISEQRLVQIIAHEKWPSEGSFEACGK